MKLKRYSENPIVIPGGQYWRRIATFNPGVILDDDGTFYMIERAVSNLAPLYSHFGLLRSRDGFHFEHVVDTPVMTAADFGTPRGTVEDPRMVKIDGQFLMTYVHRNYASSCFPNGKGIPNYHNPSDLPPGEANNYRSGIASSPDLIHWTDLGRVTPPDVDDRDCILFPEKIGGRFAMLRRPQKYSGPQYGGVAKPSIWLAYSDDLRTWTEPQLVATVEQEWEGVKVGAGATPLRTETGWLLIYHGVDNMANYRTGLLLLDLDNPAKIIARLPHPIFAPETYYEKVGLIIPNVVFPSANVVHNGTVYVYYGACDSCICVATCPLDEMLGECLKFRR